MCKRKSVDIFVLSYSVHFYSLAHEFFRKPFPLNIIIFFSFFLYTFFLLQISFLVWIVLPEVKIGHSSENIPRRLQVNRGLLMCKTCSRFWMAQGIIRKTAGSSPAPRTIWKGVKFSLFRQNAFPKPTFIDKYFRRDSTGKSSFRSQSPCTSDYSTAVQT